MIFVSLRPVIGACNRLMMQMSRPCHSHVGGVQAANAVDSGRRQRAPLCMVERALRITGKTRDAHEVAMNGVADAIKRLFIQWRLIDAATARSPWCIDDGFAALAGRTLGGRRVLIFEAAVEVWTSYYNAVGPRESIVDTLATLADSAEAYSAVRRDSAVSAYLSNISRWGAVFELQCEPRTLRSAGLDARFEALTSKVEALRAEAADLTKVLAERRQPGLALALYGPNGAGPNPHFAYLLHCADFTDRQIALIRGDMRSRRQGTDGKEWQADLERAAKNVYLEIRRVRQKLAETKAN